VSPGPMLQALRRAYRGRGGVGCSAGERLLVHRGRRSVRRDRVGGDLVLLLAESLQGVACGSRRPASRDGGRAPLHQRLDHLPRSRWDDPGEARRERQAHRDADHPAFSSYEWCQWRVCHAHSPGAPHTTPLVEEGVRRVSPETLAAVIGGVAGGVVGGALGILGALLGLFAERWMRRWGRWDAS
jgi:hypothetical protein